MRVNKELNNLAEDTNKFIEKTLEYFGLQEGETLICFKCTQFFNLLCEKLFICRFLFDSIRKGIDYHISLNPRKLKEIHDILNYW